MNDRSLYLWLHSLWLHWWQPDVIWTVHDAIFRLDFSRSLFRLHEYDDALPPRLQAILTDIHVFQRVNRPAASSFTQSQRGKYCSNASYLIGTKNSNLATVNTLYTNRKQIKSNALRQKRFAYEQRSVACLRLPLELALACLLAKYFLHSMLISKIIAAWEDWCVYCRSHTPMQSHGSQPHGIVIFQNT